MLHRLYLAPSKATPSKLKAIVDDVRDAYAAADAALGDFSFLDESNLRDRVLKAMLTSLFGSGLTPGNFLKYASRRVLDLAGAGELREAIFVRLVTQESIPVARRQSLQLASLRHSCRSEASRQYLGCAVGLVVTGPQSSHHHHLLARGAWDEVSRGRPITMSLIDEALVTAAQELYQKATAAVEESGRRLDAARGLQAGTGEAFLLSPNRAPGGHLLQVVQIEIDLLDELRKWRDLLEQNAINDDHYQAMKATILKNLNPPSLSTINFEKLLDIYDLYNPRGPTPSRGSAASPLGFWAGDA